jgi:putative selenate reductase
MDEASRCLQCDLVCNICVTVCPNRANMALPAEPVTYPVQVALADGSVRTLGEEIMSQPYQIINVADFCNECGNCRTFCPTSGAPYQDKYRVHLSRTGLEAHGEGFFLAGPGEMVVMNGGRPGMLTRQGRNFTYEDETIRAILHGDSLAAEQVELKQGADERELRPIVEAILLYNLLRAYPLFR